MWTAILGGIAPMISAPSFETWFKTTKATSLNEYCLTVEVENEFHRNWINQRYGDQINKIKNTILPEEIEVILIVKNNKSATTIERYTSKEKEYEELVEMISELTVRVDYLENEIKRLEETRH